MWGVGTTHKISFRSFGMVKKRLRGLSRSRFKLRKRQVELRAEAKRKAARAQKHRVVSQGKSKKEAIAKAKKGRRLHLRPELRTLLVGEGNFSFTRALIRGWEREQRRELEAHDREGEVLDVEELVGFNVVATCFDSKEVLAEKYPDVKDIVREIKASGVTVHTGTDATELLSSKRVVTSLADLSESFGNEASIGFDRIIFNFPHLGTGESDKSLNIAQHRDFLTRFLVSAHPVLADSGQVWITLKSGEPYDSWRISQLAVQTGLFKVHSQIPFDPSIFEGYEHRRTVGAPAQKLDANADIIKDSASTFIFVKS